MKTGNEVEGGRSGCGPLCFDGVTDGGARGGAA